MDELERLLKKTKYKKEAAEIAQRIQKAGLTLATVADAPRVFGHSLWGHNTYQVLDAIQQARLTPDEPIKPIKKPDIEPVKSEE